MKKKIKVLVLIDVQNDFIDGALSNENAQKVIPNIVNKIEKFDGDAIIYTLDTHDKDYLKTKEGEKLPVEHCIIDTHGWDLNKDIKNALIEKHNDGYKISYILKPTFGSVCNFMDDNGPTTNTLVECVLNIEKGTSSPTPMEIEMCGFCTDICVVSNALILKAFTYDFAEITVDSSCCAGVTPEKHEAALDVMRSCQINVI